MKYYVVYDDSLYPDRDKFMWSHVIAFHESKRVVHEYAQRLQKEAPQLKTIIFSVKESKIISNTNYYDRYLIRYGNKYIQSKFYDLIKEDYQTAIRETIFCKEILMKYLEYEKLSKSDKKALEKVVSFLDEKKEDIKNDVPSFNALKLMEIEREEKMMASIRWDINPDESFLWE